MAAHYLKVSIILIVLSVIIAHVASDNVYIVSSPNQDCPQQASTCLTLQQYITGNYTTNFTSLQILSGIHRIHSNNTNISMSNIYSFEVNGINAMIICNSNYLKFINIDVVSIRGVRLMGCTGIRFNSIRVLSMHSTHFEHHGPVIINSIFNATLMNLSITDGHKLLVYNSTLLVRTTLFSNLTVSDDYFECHQDPHGGAIRMDNSNVTIEESLFTNNCAYCVNSGWGGAVYANNSTLNIAYSYFTGNQAYVGGGAISADHSEVQVNGSYFSYNTALENGGAIQTQHVTQIERSVFIKNCSFIRNNAHQGGVLYVAGNSNTVNISQSTFDSNVANITGGTLYIMGNRSVVVIYKCDFLNSRAQKGGTLNFIGSNSSIYIVASNFKNSKAVQTGGTLQVLVDSTSISIHLCNFSNNTADITGGAIYLEGYLSDLRLADSTFNNNSAARCAVLEVVGADYVNLINGNFIHNTAKRGYTSGGVACITNGSTNITNSIFYHNEALGNAGVLSTKGSYLLVILDTIFKSNRAGNDGGVAYIRNTYSTAISNSSFQRNEASENAGVLYIENSILSIFDSSFNSNKAGRNGGVIYWNTILPGKSIFVEVFHSNFSSNQAVEDGGVMHVSSRGSKVTVTNGTFAYNNATGKGGVIAITGSQLYLNQNTIFYNTATYGSVISACRTNVTDSDDLVQIVEPTTNDSDCSFYDEYQNMPTTTTTAIKTTEMISTSHHTEASTTSPTSLSETTTTPGSSTSEANTKPETSETPTNKYSTPTTPNSTKSDDHSMVPTIPNIYTTAIYTTLGIAIVVCVLLALLYIIVLCIVLYLCGVFKSKKRLVDNPYVYVPMNENESTADNETAPQ